jgi:peptidoglycan-associated lipoprotein
MEHGTSNDVWLKLKRGSLLFGGVLLCVAILAGCPKPPEVKLASPPVVRPEDSTPATPPGASPGIRQEDIPVARRMPPEEVPVQPSPPMESRVPAKDVASSVKDIFFDYDEWTISDDQKAILNGNAAWLKANSAARIRIEGHADERGTNEYNLALGERRAKATRDHLVAIGIDATRIATISYGEERPFVLGHDERAWKWNRRAHFVITSQ